MPHQTHQTHQPGAGERRGASAQAERRRRGPPTTKREAGGGAQQPTTAEARAFERTRDSLSLPRGAGRGRPCPQGRKWILSNSRTSKSRAVARILLERPQKGGKDVSRYLPGQASYLAALHPFSPGGSLSPGETYFPSWLSPEGTLTIDLPNPLVNPALVDRIGALRKSRLRWARGRRLTIDKEPWSTIEGCPPCSLSGKLVAPFCRELQLCPYCYGRAVVEHLYRSVALLVERSLLDGIAVYVSLDAAHHLMTSPGSPPLLGTARSRRGLIAACHPERWLKTEVDSQSYLGAARVFYPLPLPAEGAEVSKARPWTVLTARWLRVHAAEPEPMVSPQAHICRRVTRLSELVPLVAAACSFPAWLLDPAVDNATVERTLRWFGRARYVVPYGALAPNHHLHPLRFVVGSKATASPAVQRAIRQRYATQDLPDPSLDRITNPDLVEAAPVERPSHHAAGVSLTDPSPLDLWSDFQVGASTTQAGTAAPAFPEMREEVESARVFRGPDGQLYVVMPAQSAAPLDTLS